MRHGSLMRVALFTLLACGPLARGADTDALPTDPAGQLNVFSGLASGSLLTPVEPADSDPVVAGTLNLRGLIDADMVRRFRLAVDRGHVTTVRISSQGGFIADALVIGQLMRERGIDVVVTNLCAGPCAAYVFLGARKRMVEPGALVGFQSTIESAGIVVDTAAHALDMPNPLKTGLARQAAVEADFFRSSGVADRFVPDLRMAIQTRCVTVRRNAGSSNWTAPNTYALWIPTRSYLKSIGVEFEGEWPTSRRQVAKLARPLLQPWIVNFLRFGSEDHLRRPGEKAYSPDSLRDCVMEEVKPVPAN